MLSSGRAVSGFKEWGQYDGTCDLGHIWSPRLTVASTQTASTRNMDEGHRQITIRLAQQRPAEFWCVALPVRQMTIVGSMVHAEKPLVDQWLWSPISISLEQCPYMRDFSIYLAWVDGGICLFSMLCPALGKYILLPQVRNRNPCSMG